MTVKSLSINLYRQLDLPRLLFAIVGFVPIGSLCLALFGLMPLHLSTRFAVLPAAAFGTWLGMRYPRIGWLAFCGLLGGMVATAIYDTIRFAFVWSGVWSDFIPAIGRMALRDQSAHPFWGYLWRYLGNGGAMGMAFAMCPWRSIRAGMAYGTSICLCLFATLMLAPGAQTALFPLTPMTAFTALIGHLTYGGVLALALRGISASTLSRQN